MLPQLNYNYILINQLDQKVDSFFLIDFAVFNICISEIVCWRQNIYLWKSNLIPNQNYFILSLQRALNGFRFAERKTNNVKENAGGKMVRREQKQTSESVADSVLSLQCVWPPDGWGRGCYNRNFPCPWH